MLSFKKFTLPDWLSFYRVVAAPILVVLLFLDFRLLFTWLLLISFLTDAVDGFLARKLKITSIRGSQLDSLGDQLTFAIGVLGLFYFEYDFMFENLWLILIAFSPYVVQMVIALIKYGKTTAFHTYLAKISAILQALFILCLLFFGPIYWLFYAVIIIGVIETIEEILLIFMYDNWVTEVKGLYWALEDERRLKKR